MPCLEAHYPLDLVILALGSNDTKIEFNRTPQRIAEGLEKLISLTKGKDAEVDPEKLKILILSPPKILSSSLKGEYRAILKDANSKATQLNSLYGEIAKKHGALFLSLYDLVDPGSEDGVHFDKDGHAKVAKLLFSLITSLTSVPSA